MVSIITPTWACADFIAETIKSIQAQTYQNWELLIQDDCSKDNTLEVVKPFMETDGRIKYECNPSLIFTKLLQKNWNGTLAKFKK
ncbi:glycosyltransferase [uncultured Prevotella sp.]|uniref:glycosyltransferase family 2 protein n=1 Tax=uncultured Prevotella sp. TaxID=159272 RepID=UPI0026717B21|nr:glycosyltransferase [uncultured Prevotella sp.]